jgi:hypothetical protein
LQAKFVQNEEELKDAFSVRKQVFVDEQNVSSEEKKVLEKSL